MIRVAVRSGAFKGRAGLRLGVSPKEEVAEDEPADVDLEVSQEDEQASHGVLLFGCLCRVRVHNTPLVQIYQHTIES